MNTDPPIYRAVVHHTGSDPRRGRHDWIDEPRTEETAVARHTDLDGDGIADAAADQRDIYAHDDHGCDQPQNDPDRWVGVQRDPDWLPVGADDHSGGDDRG